MVRSHSRSGPLYDLVKDKPGIQVITLNIDDNPGAVEPVVKAGGYTFPVIPARDWVSAFAAPLGVPQNWLVDPNGVVRQTSGGFEASPDWAKRMLDKLTGK